jgi:hypothetical protein
MLFRYAFTLTCVVAFLLNVRTPAHSNETDWVHPSDFLGWEEVPDEQAEAFELSQTAGNEPVEPESPPRLINATLQSPIVDTTLADDDGGVVMPISRQQLDRVATNAWQILPDGLMYRSYLAGEKEPRFASQWLWEKDRGRIWEAVVGGRWGLLRKGTDDPDPEGFQFDVVGAAFVRIDPVHDSDLEAADFNAGFFGTWHYGQWRYKFGYTHYSCHVGDEFMIRNPTYIRHNYVRDSLVLGTTYDVTKELQLYGEIGAALNHNGGAQLIELQYGAQYSPHEDTGFRGAPFAAINGHSRQEFNFCTSVNVEAGWAWRNGQSGRLFRVGLQHYNGPAMQWSFVHQFESLTGFACWFDY